MRLYSLVLCSFTVGEQLYFFSALSTDAIVMSGKLYQEILPFYRSHDKSAFVAFFLAIQTLLFYVSIETLTEI